MNVKGEKEMFKRLIEMFSGEGEEQTTTEFGYSLLHRVHRNNNGTRPLSHSWEIIFKGGVKVLALSPHSAWVYTHAKSPTFNDRGEANRLASKFNSLKEVLDNNEELKKKAKEMTAIEYEREMQSYERGERHKPTRTKKR